MLRDDIALYTKLTGKNGWNVPLMNLGYLDGYYKGLELLDTIRTEIELHRRKTASIDPYDLVGDCLVIIDKYRAESEEPNEN